MSALDNLIYGLQNFRLFIQDDVELCRPLSYPRRSKTDFQVRGHQWQN